MTNTQLKRKAKQIVMLIEMGRITPEQVKRKVRPQFWNDYVLPLLKEKYIPLIFGIAFGSIKDAIRIHISLDKSTIEHFREAVEKDMFEELADLESRFNDKPITADQMRQSMEKDCKAAQERIKYYCETYPSIVSEFITKKEVISLLKD